MNACNVCHFFLNYFCGSCIFSKMTSPKSQGQARAFVVQVTRDMIPVRNTIWAIVAYCVDKRQKANFECKENE